MQGIVENQMLMDSDLWTRQEHCNGIHWNRHSKDVSKQSMYSYFANTQKWYFYLDSTVRGEEIVCPKIELLFRNRNVEQNLGD